MSAANTLNRERTVLYVEDDDLTRQSVGLHLDRNGFRVVPARDGEEATRAAMAESRLDAVLLDIELPGIDGVETCRRLRENRPDVPVVICSARLDASTRRRLESLGIPRDRLLAKPCPSSKIVAVLETAMGDDA